MAVVVPVVLVLVLLGMAVGIVVEAARGDRSSVSNVALLVGLLLVWAAGLALAARGLARRRRWARAPVLLSDLLLLAVGVPLAQGSASRWAGVLLVVVSAVGAVAVMTPPVTAALEE